jgi:hypothetical protein
MMVTLLFWVLVLKHPFQSTVLRCIRMDGNWIALIRCRLGEIYCISSASASVASNHSACWRRWKIQSLPGFVDSIARCFQRRHPRGNREKPLSPHAFVRQNDTHRRSGCSRRQFHPSATEGGAACGLKTSTRASLRRGRIALTGPLAAVIVKRRNTHERFERAAVELAEAPAAWR